MNVLPFALETQPTWQETNEAFVIGMGAVACCGCEQSLATSVFVRIVSQVRKAGMTLAPGYRRNGAGEYLRKRHPRRPSEGLYLREGSANELESARGYVGEGIEQDAVVVCHRCGRRQIVRVQ